MKKNIKGKVYIVCAMDTEGPIINKKKPDILDTWKKIKKLIDELTSEKFRNKYKDSGGKGLIYSWFILTLTGFKTNPYKRPMNYHEVYDFYSKMYSKNFKKYKDEIYWHYHQPAPSRIGNEWSKDWTSSQEYFNILSRLLIERSYFPSCFRAGGRIEDNDLSHWLEQWIPFDYSCCSGNINWNRRESDGQKLRDVCDWSLSSKSWSGYNPSNENYQLPGKQKRYMFRCPDLNSPVHKLSDYEIRNAFKNARNGKNSLLSFFDHDRRYDVIDNIADVCYRIKKISKEFKEIKWYYKNAKDAANLQLNLKKINKPKFYIKLMDQNRIFIEVDKEIFGRTPFLCQKINNKKINELSLNILGKQKWISPPLINLNKRSNFSLAANNKNGDTAIIHFKMNKNKINVLKGGNK
jgi:hypothetical protein